MLASSPKAAVTIGGVLIRMLRIACAFISFSIEGFSKSILSAIPPPIITISGSKICRVFTIPIPKFVPISSIISNESLSPFLADCATSAAETRL